MRRSALLVVAMLAVGACESTGHSTTRSDAQRAASYEDCRALATYLGEGGFSHDDTYDPRSDVLLVYGEDGRRFRIAPQDTDCVSRSPAVAVRVHDAVGTYESISGEDSQSSLLRAATPPDPADARYHGVPVWWAPSATAEAQLEWLDSPIPRSIDLAAGQPAFQPGERALGVFAVTDGHARPPRFVVLTSSGATRQLLESHIEANRDQDGNTAALLPADGGLSPEGRHLAIAQPSSLELYDLVSGTWTTIDTGNWLAEGARWLDDATIWVADRLVAGTGGSAYGVDGALVDSSVTPVERGLAVSPDDQPYGSRVDAPDAQAGSYFLHGPIRGGRYTNPEGVISRVGGTTAVLAIDIAGRRKACCPVAGVLSDGTVAFESNGRVLGWKPGSGTVGRLAELTGLDQGKDHASSSWAGRALRR